MANVFDQFDSPSQAPPAFDPAKYAAYKQTVDKPNVFDQFDPPQFDQAKLDAMKRRGMFDDLIPNKPGMFDDLIPQQQSTASDIAKSIGAGAIEGPMHAAQAPGMARQMLGAATDYIGNKLGASPESIDKFKDLAQKAATASPIPGAGIIANAPSPQSVQSAVEGAAGHLYQPQTMPGRFAQSATEAATNPASYFGPGGWIEKLVMAGASGLGAQGGSELFHGTPLETPARIIGGIAAGPMAARAMNPQLSGAQRALSNAGVDMTPGQMLGGQFKSIEDKATSIPGLGDLIQSARGRSIEGFNRAVGNEALAPIGERVDRGISAGHELVDHVETKLGDAYDRLLPQINYIPDRQLGADLARINQSDVSLLPAPLQEQYRRIIDNVVGPPAPMGGTMFKSIESELNARASNYMSSSIASERDLGRALSNTTLAMRANLERATPDFAQELRNINRGWAMFARMRAAAGNRATSQGVFLPSDLLRAIRSGDKSAGKGAFARGDALLQDLAESGQEVLPSKIPDSGTAGRGMLGALGAGIAGGGVGWLLHRPELIAAGLAAAAPYASPVSRGINYLARPTTGFRGQYAEAGRGLGMLRPLAVTPLSALPNQ